MKRAIALLLLAIFALPATALAKGKAVRRDVQGTVVTVSETSITVNTRQGDRTYTITPRTVLMQSARGAKASTFAKASSIKVGAKVTVAGARDRRTAERIRVID